MKKQNVIIAAALIVILTGSAVQAQTPGLTSTMGLASLQAQIDSIKTQISQLMETARMRQQTALENVKTQQEGVMSQAQTQIDAAKNQDQARIAAAKEKMTTAQVQEKLEEIKNLARVGQNGIGALNSSNWSVVNNGAGKVFSGSISVANIGTITASSKEELIQKLKNLITGGNNGTALTEDQKAKIQSIIAMVENGAPMNSATPYVTNAAQKWQNAMTNGLQIDDNKAAAIKASLEETKTLMEKMIADLNAKNYIQFKNDLSSIIENKTLTGYSILHTARCAE